MTYRDKESVFKEFFNKGCENLIFPECEELLKEYNQSLGGKGCSRCKMGRIRRRFKSILLKTIGEKKITEVIRRTQAEDDST